MITNKNIKTVFMMIVAASFALVLVPVIVGAFVAFVVTNAAVIGFTLGTVTATTAICAALLPVQPVISYEIVG